MLILLFLHNIFSRRFCQVKITLPLSRRSYCWGQPSDAWEIPPSTSNVFTVEVLIKNANEHEHFKTQN